MIWMSSKVTTNMSWWQRCRSKLIEQSYLYATYGSALRRTQQGHSSPHWASILESVETDDVRMIQSTKFLTSDAIDLAWIH